MLGSTESEIAAIEGAHAVTLPATYREFLAAGGRQFGHFLTGTDYLQRHIATLRSQAERLLHENGAPFKLLPTQFVFLCHQGYRDELEARGS